MHAIMNNMVVTLTLFALAFAPQTTTFTGEWLLTWDQNGSQFIPVSVTQEGAAARVTWENESLLCTLTNNVCEGAGAGFARDVGLDDAVVEEGAGKADGAAVDG